MAITDKVGTVDAPPRLIRTERGLALKYGDQDIEVPRLKHGAVFVLVSNIATQYSYCEYKLHLDYVKGREILSYIREGLYEHRRQLGNFESFDFDIDPIPGQKAPVLINVGLDGEIYFNKVVSERWIFKLIKESEKIIIEPAIVDVIENVPILAQPDIVIVDSNNTVTLIELKTTSTNPYKLREQEKLQVQLYAYLLEKHGFKLKHTCIVKVRRHTRFILKNNINRIVELLDNKFNSIVKVGKDVVVHKINTSDCQTIENIIRWALEYWLYKRNPLPKPSPTKCKGCIHNRICNFKLLL